MPAGGTISVPLYTRLEKEGYHSIRASFPEPTQYDALPADNQNLLVVRAMKEVRVLVVDGDREARDIRDHESFFLQVALSPVENHYVKVDVKSPEQYAQGGLNRYTAVVMANVPRFTSDNVAGLQTYLRNGGGLIFYPGDKIDTDFYNRELFEKHGLLPSPWGDPSGDATQDEVLRKVGVERARGLTMVLPTDADKSLYAVLSARQPRDEFRVGAPGDDGVLGGGDHVSRRRDGFGEAGREGGVHRGECRSDPAEGRGSQFQARVGVELGEHAVEAFTVVGEGALLEAAVPFPEIAARGAEAEILLRESQPPGEPDRETHAEAGPRSRSCRPSAGGSTRTRPTSPTS